MNNKSHLFDKNTDDELLILIQNGDTEAFGVIYNRYHELLYILAYKYLKDKDLSKDAIQYVFLKLWESRSVLSVTVSLKNYLYTMLKNHVLNEIRNNLSALEKKYELAQFSIQEETTIIEKLEEKEITEQLYKLVYKLPEQKRQVCLYKLRDNLSNQEIADKMDISISTVKSHYTQAIKTLRDQFGKIILLVLMFFL